MGEGETGILRKPPRDPKEPILGRTQWLAVILQAMVLAAGTFAALLAAHWLAFDALQSVTVTFLTLAFGQLWHVFNMRSGSSGVFLNEVTRNGWVWAALVLCSLLLAVPPYIPQTADLLHVTPLTAEMWAVVMGCSLAPLVLMQLSVAIFGRHKVRMI
jgi:Ca2+-transporting ATPase